MLRSGGDAFHSIRPPKIAAFHTIQTITYRYGSQFMNGAGSGRTERCAIKMTTRPRAHLRSTPRQPNVHIKRTRWASGTTVDPRSTRVSHLFVVKIRPPPPRNEDGFPQTVSFSVPIGTRQKTSPKNAVDRSRSKGCRKSDNMSLSIRQQENGTRQAPNKIFIFHLRRN
jgi:hypothetical protein